MKKLIALAALSLATACTQTGQPQGHTEGMSCKCCQEMMKEGCKCCQGMSGDMMKEGSGCCCKGMMSGSGMDMKDGKGMMCEKTMQEKAEKKPVAKSKAAPVIGSEHEQHH
jgi:hypothetical protein